MADFQSGDFLAGDFDTVGGPFPHFIRRSNAMTGGMIGMGMVLLIWLAVI